MRSLLLFFFLLFPFLLAAQTPHVAVEVEGSRIPRQSATASSQVILPKDVPTAQTAIELLETATGVQLKRYGGLDNFAQISIRGSTSEQVLIYLDGVPLNTAQGGFVDLGLLPVETIERIEVYRGGSPGKSSDSTAGGTIYIHTKTYKEKKTILNNRLGAFYTYRGFLQHQNSFKENHYYNFSFEHFRSRGDFDYLDDKGTRNNKSDDIIRGRDNNDFQNYDFITRFGSQKEVGWNWDLHNNFFLKQQGIPGLGNQTSTTADLHTMRNLTQLDLKSPEHLSYTINGKMFFDYNNSEFRDPNGEIGFGTQNNDDTTLRFGPEATLHFPYENHFFTTFLGQRAELFSPKNRASTNPEGPTSQRHRTALGIEDEMRFLNETLMIDPSVRLEVYINDLSGTDPSQTTTAGDNTHAESQVSTKLGLRFAPKAFVTMHANVYRGFRAPNFGELFGDRGTIVGNTALKSEKSFNFDTGIRFQGSHFKEVRTLTLEAIYFRHQLDQLIQFLQTSQFTLKAQNLGKAIVQGLELTGHLELSDKSRLTAFYIFQTAKDNQPGSATFGNFLPGRPKYQISVTGEFPIGKFTPSAHWQWISHNFIDSQNLVRIDHRSIFSAALSWNAKNWLTLHLSTKNLTNERVSDIAGYPLPGRSFWGEVKTQW